MGTPVQFRHRPLGDACPFTFVAADALTMKVREGGRVVSCCVLVATEVNSDGHREVLGMQVATGERAAAWKQFFTDLVARGLKGVRLVTSGAHPGLAGADRGEPARSRLAAALAPTTWECSIVCVSL
mgnify:CR=1 FL=1